MVLKKLWHKINSESPKKPAWEAIGEVSPVAGCGTKDVPKWVLKAADRISWEDRKQAIEDRKYFILKGRTYEYALEWNGIGAEYLYIGRRKRARAQSKADQTRKRRRSTAVVIRDDKVLLVRDRGQQLFSLPGGGIERGERSINAATRELFEETSLRTLKIERLFDHESEHTSHRVFLVEAEGNATVGKELSAIMWWDRKSEVPRFRHVDDILQKYDDRRSQEPIDK